MFGYSVTRPNLEKDYFNDVYNLLHDFGIPLEGWHTETGPGVYEAALEYSECLLMADRAHLFKVFLSYLTVDVFKTNCVI
jgi:glutamine synthetase